MKSPAFQVQLLCVISLIVAANVSSARGQGPVEPLLQKYCLSCHNQNDKEAGLSLQTREAILAGSENGAVLDSDDLSKSLLIQVLTAGGEKSMPPDGEPQPTPAEREQLRQWVLGGVKLQPIMNGKPQVPDVKPFYKRAEPLLSSMSVPDGSRFVLGGGRTVTLMDAASKKPVWSVGVETEKIAGLSYGAQHQWIAAAVGLPGVSGRAVVLSAADGSVVREFTGHTDAAYAAVFSPDERLLATAGYDRRILLHDVATGQILKTLEGHNGSIFALSFDPSGKIVCSASADGTVKVWHVATGERLDTLSQPQGEQYAVTVSPDGQRIYAAGADNRIRIWKLISMDKPIINPALASVFGHEQPIAQMAISPSGNVLATAAEDRTLRIWKAFPLEPLQTMPVQESGITSLTFLNDSQLLVTRLNGTWDVLSVTAAVDSNSGVPQQKTAAGMVQPVLPDQVHEVTEVGANDEPATAPLVSLPAKIVGTIRPDGGNDRDFDCFRFAATAGQQLILEVMAQRNKSPLDSRIEVLTAAGEPVLQTNLQAVRDSYFTFRGKDSDTVDDFRVFNWQEMELNEYLYADGEVVKLWLYPRGPDSGYKVYPGTGKRFTYFGTTPTSHALQAPCFIVVPRRPDEAITGNGLPTFPIYFENDDDPRREWGSDSRLFFTAPATGEYVARITDARGFSGEDYRYELTVRPPKPGFTVAVKNRKISVAAGTGKGLLFTARRIDGYEGPIRIDMTGLPPGYEFSGPLTIEAGQFEASGIVFATSAAVEPSPEQVKQVQIRATTEHVGEQDLGGLEELKLITEPKLRLHVINEPSGNSGTGDKDSTVAPQANSVVLDIVPGQTIRAMLKVDRLNHNGIISLGKEESGHNLPHGVFVDNIGLNGLLLLEDQSEREFFVTAAKWVPEMTRTFYLESNVDGITTLPITLRVLPAPASALAGQ